MKIFLVYGLCEHVNGNGRDIKVMNTIIFANHAFEAQRDAEIALSKAYPYGEFVNRIVRVHDASAFFREAMKRGDLDDFIR